MGKRWVQLTTIQQLEKNGSMETYHPGDWVSVNKQTAQLWLARGDACEPQVKAFMPTLAAGGNSGIITRDESKVRDVMRDTPFEIEQLDEPKLLYEKTIVYDPELVVRPVFFAIGLGLLDTWELAAPLYDYKVLAGNAGTDGERERTLEVIGDLRVPMWDIRLMFVRRCEATEKLFADWREEQGENRMLAFLRALYRNPLLALALPITWQGRHEH